MARNIIVTSVWLALLFHSFTFLPIHGQNKTDKDVTTANPVGGANDSLLPSTVAEIVQAISNVQRNVTKETVSKVPNIKVAGGGNVQKNVTTKTVSKVPNIKVAGVVQGGKNSSDGRPLNASSAVVDPQLELTLFKPDLNFSKVDGNDKQDTKDAQDDVSSTTVAIDTTTTSVEAVDDVPAGNTTVEADEEDLDQTVAEAPFDGNLTVSLDPPAVSIFSYDGASQWFNWAVAMRDPTMNPEGTLSWPTIVTRGMQGIFQYYNPLRRFLARSLDTASTLNSVASDIYKHRRDVILALLSKEINPDMNSINEYVKNLETNKKVAERISLLADERQSNNTGLDGILEDFQDGLSISTIRNVTAALNDALDLLVEPLNPVPDQWHRFAEIFGSPFTEVLRAPFHIKFVNFGLKALYVLISDHSPQPPISSTQLQSLQPTREDY